MSEKKKKIFVSYQRKDESQVKELVGVLESSGQFEVWYDGYLKTGQNWWDEIIKHIEWADVVVLALSQTYLKSYPCELERGYANQLGKAISPLKIDPQLKYETVPVDIASLQIREYSGKANQFQIVQDELQELSSPPLPDEMPEAPPAPPPPVKDNRMLIAIAVVVALVVIVGIAFILMQAESPSSDNNEPDNGASQIENSPVPGEIGDYDISLQYGEQNSFTVIVNSNSNLWDVRIGSTLVEDDVVLTDRFPDLRETDYMAEAGICFQFERPETSPIVPLACETTFRRQVTDEQIFWFDSSSNLYANVAIRHGNDSPRLCPHDNGRGGCDISTEE